MNQVVERIQAFNQGRDPRLLQLKYKLMQANAFAFFRGTCHLFYQDWPASSPLNAAPALWICGDLHLQNLGCYKGDNRLVYFNINDFDEAILAPYSWELARFLTCLLVAAPTLKINAAKALALCSFFLDAYTKEIARGRVRLVDDDNAVGPARELLFHVKQRPRTAFLNAHTTQNGGKRKLLIDEQHLCPATEAERSEINAIVQKWAAQQPDPNFYSILDCAQRIAGIGSLGVKRYVLLVEGHGSPDRNALLDLKQEGESSLQPYASTHQPHWPNQAERCVRIQQWVQGIAPALLAPVAIEGQYYVLRELQPIEDKVNVESVAGKLHRLEQLVKMIARVIAWDHLRCAGRHGAADAHEIMEFVRTSDWQKEILHYVKSYATQVNKDYQTFCAAYKDGKLKN